MREESDDCPSRIGDSDPGRSTFTNKSNCLREAEKPAGPPPYPGFLPRIKNGQKKDQSFRLENTSVGGQKNKFQNLAL